jgi:hypothetical protein
MSRELVSGFRAAPTTKQSNKALVLEFYAALDRAEARGTLRQEIRNIANHYLRPDYIQHSAAAPRKFTF